MIDPVFTESELVQSVQSLEPGNVVRLIEYNAYSHSEKQLERLENLTDSLLDGGVRWFHLQGRPNDDALEALLKGTESLGKASNASSFGTLSWSNVQTQS